MIKKKISVVTPCYNEVENVQVVHEKIKSIFSQLKNYDYEHIYIDNASTDHTQEKLRAIAKNDPHVKIILNARNFGHICSPLHGYLQATGDAIVSMASDLQEPPDLIPEFIRHWEDGYKIVIGVKTTSEHRGPMLYLRKFYYHLLTQLSQVKQVKHFTGFGLYDRQVIDIVRAFRDPYPYFRGIIAELGFDRKEIEFTEPRRKRGKSSNNLYTLYDMAILGFVNQSKVPLRLAVFFGFFASFASLVIALFYLGFKILHWDSFEMGIAPLVIGGFFFAALQLFFIGILGEYIGAIYTHVKQRPLVIEKERINFK